MTICTCDRVCCLSEIDNDNLVLKPLGRIVEEQWLRTEMVRPDICVKPFVVMPNHIHGIITISGAVAGGASTLFG